MAKMNPTLNQSNAINAKTNNRWLIALLVLTLVATAWTALHEDSDKVNTGIVLQHISSNKPQSIKAGASSSTIKQVALEQAAPNDKSGNQDALIPWKKLKREPNKIAAYDLFKVHSWLVVPPVKKVKPVPPPPPVAPPVPFIYVGKLDNTPTGTQIFLMANNKLYTVVKGEKINQQWRFDNEEGELLRFTFLPLSLQQTLSKFAKPAVAQAETTAEINEHKD